MINDFINRLGVCSWSLRPENSEELVAYVKASGLSMISLHLDPLRLDDTIRKETAKLLQKENIRIGSGMWACEGEDYTSLESIRRTGGIRPDKTWRSNLKAAKENAALAQDLGINLVTFHAGFFPHNTNAFERRIMLDRLRTISDIFGEHGINAGLETGQETAETLLTVLADLNRENIGVNFDPANMILYGMGNPVESLKLLNKHIIQVHIKDAIPAKNKSEWGKEVAIGQGRVVWTDFFRALEDTSFSGNLMIERESGNQRIHDVSQAVKYLSELKW